MRFAVVAAFFAGAVMANDMSTVYQTQVQTVTSCAPEVSDCPGATEVPEPEVPEMSSSYPSAMPTPYGNGTHTMSYPMVPSGVPTAAPSSEACGGVSIKTISTSVTTVIPTVIYETIDLPCPTEAPSSVSGVPSGIPSGTPAPSAGLPPTEEPVFTGGASTMGFSLVAAAAGLVAFLA